MPIRDVHANKKGNTTPLLTLVRGDNLTQIIRMIVQRRYGGVDLSDLTWSIVLENADGVTDNHYISDVEINDDSIEVRWNVHHVATAFVGDTRFELEGIKYDEDGSKIPVWQSGIYYIRITEDINHTPSELEIKQLTAVQQLILYVDGELKNVLAAKDEAEKAATAAMKAVNKANELAEEVKKIIEGGGGLPEGSTPYQQLVTDGDGNTRWEDRTHYSTIAETFIEIIGTVSLAQTSSESMGSKFYTISDEMVAKLNPEYDYKMAIDGTEYECTKTLYPDGSVSKLFTDDVMLSDGTNIGSVHLNPTSNSLVIANAYGVDISAYSVVIAAFEVTETIHPIDPKYLPKEKQYTLTETITLAEAINSKTLTFTEDADSYQLALSCPAAEAALGLSAEVYTADGLVAYMWMAGMIDTTAKYAKCSMYRAHGEWVFESMQPVNNENQTSAISRNPKFVSAEKPITKIVVYASSGGMMPAGTTIEVRT